MSGSVQLFRSATVYSSPAVFIFSNKFKNKFNINPMNFGINTLKKAPMTAQGIYQTGYHHHHHHYHHYHVIIIISISVILGFHTTVV
jgi:hypothetical protein